MGFLKGKGHNVQCATSSNVHKQYGKFSNLLNAGADYNETETNHHKQIQMSPFSSSSTLWQTQSKKFTASKRGTVGRWIFKSSYASSSFTAPKCIAVMETICHHHRGKKKNSKKKVPHQAETCSKRLWLPFCTFTLRLTLIHQSINTILYSCKLHFPTLREEEGRRPFSPESYSNRRQHGK